MLSDTSKTMIEQQSFHEKGQEKNGRKRQTVL